MAKVAWYTVIDRALQSVGQAQYRYGTKWEKPGKAKQQSLIKAYPKYYSGSRATTALQTADRLSTDCSGLVMHCTDGLVLGSSAYMSKALSKLDIRSINAHHGAWASYKPGHIGLVIDRHTIVEARGFDYGTVKTDPAKRDFTTLLQLHNVDYDAYSPKTERECTIVLQTLCNIAGADIKVDAISGPATKAAIKKYLMKL